MSGYLTLAGAVVIALLSTLAWGMYQRAERAGLMQHAAELEVAALKADLATADDERKRNDQLLVEREHARQAAVIALDGAKRKLREIPHEACLDAPLDPAVLRLLPVPASP